MKSQVVPLRVPGNLIELATLCSQEQHTDRATTLRQWLYKGAEEAAIKLVEEGRITSGQAAQLLDMNIHGIYRLAEARGIRLGATEEQQERSWEYAQKLRGELGEF